MKTIAICTMLLILGSSCREVVIIDSSAEIVSRSIDETLNGSALVYGYVYSAGTANRPYLFATVWVEGSDLKANAGTDGNFNLTILPGKYTLKCLSENADPQFTATIKDITLTANEKVEVIFYHGKIGE